MFLTRGWRNPIGSWLSIDFRNRKKNVNIYLHWKITNKRCQQKSPLPTPCIDSPRYTINIYLYRYTFFQAPETMKTVSISMWYFSVALGNFIVIFVNATVTFKKKVINSLYYYYYYCMRVGVNNINFFVSENSLTCSSCSHWARSLRSLWSIGWVICSKNYTTIRNWMRKI